MRPTTHSAFARTRWSFAAVLGLPFLAAAWGCSGSSTPRTIPVHGRVTYQGQPVTQGTVTFLPLQPGAGVPSRPATGVIQPDGTYRMSTFRPEDGAAPGEYQVAIVSITSGPSPEDPEAPEVWAIPKKYGNPVQTDLQATIPADAKGPLQFDFALQDSTTVPHSIPPPFNFQET